jgi:hypothetical protein
VSGVDLVQWLRDQLDDDERLAVLLSLDSSIPDQWEAKRTRQYNCGEFTIWSGERKVAAEALEASAIHIARHDPARVLREIEAKRDLLRLAERAHDYHETFTSGFAAALEGTLRLFALAYAGRPGYREEWRP